MICGRAIVCQPSHDHNRFSIHAVFSARACRVPTFSFITCFSIPVDLDTFLLLSSPFFSCCQSDWVLKKSSSNTAARTNGRTLFILFDRLRGHLLADSPLCPKESFGSPSRDSRSPTCWRASPACRVRRVRRSDSPLGAGRGSQPIHRP